MDPSPRRPWTSQVTHNKEDAAIKLLVQQLGVRKWRVVASLLKTRFQINGRQKLLRSSKQCRQRWHNQLDPNILVDDWSLQEEKKLFQLHKIFGNRWSQIASYLPGRTDNSIKNHFYSTARRNLRKYIKMNPDCGYSEKKIQKVLENNQMLSVILKPNSKIVSENPVQQVEASRRSKRVKNVIRYTEESSSECELEEEKIRSSEKKREKIIGQNYLFEKESQVSESGGFQMPFGCQEFIQQIERMNWQDMENSGGYLAWKERTSEFPFSGICGD